MQSLDKHFRSDLRFFAFYLGNGTLIPEHVDFDTLDYTDCATRKDGTIGRVFAVYLNNKQRYSDTTQPYPAIERAAQWLAHHCVPTYHPVQPFQTWETELASEQMTITDSIKEFALSLGNGTLASPILANIEYVPCLIEYGSFLEQIVAIFANILHKSDSGQPRNVEQATERVAQYIRNYIDPTYEIIPALSDWEVELL